MEQTLDCSIPDFAHHGKPTLDPRRVKPPLRRSNPRVKARHSYERTLTKEKSALVDLGQWAIEHGEWQMAAAITLILQRKGVVCG
jgi:hypothetical protein